ncbi:hypothetical protein BDN72DRAFT_893560 [Pluteus cervinus]|uniref:Uncharacterized protein n=1 Tax=Pluteus cervinus TaxID=181527 RepID=A0ACD3B6X9_9AGAR|nr:hypothetical protein BDN72DRAFT_893560 [Pluteus cervinus]
MAFKSDQKMDDVLNLQLVAKHGVSEWLLPLIYEVVVIHIDRTWPRMGLPPGRLSRYGRHVRHLLLRVTPNISDTDVELYFTHCPNITNLALWVPYSSPRDNIPFTEYLTKLRYFTELSINIQILRQPPSESLSRISSTSTPSPIFAPGRIVKLSFISRP